MDLSRLVKAPKNKKSLPYPIIKYYNGILFLADIYNSLATFLNGRSIRPSGNKDLDDVRRRAKKRTDISDHLETIYWESLEVGPRLIVELGIGPGESTFVFEKVAKQYQSKLVSVDMKEEAGKASSWQDWIFVQADDIEFSRRFKEWASAKGIEPKIDILFIDTSHRYEHTIQEIEHWFPFLSDTAKVFFHDTNVRPIYRHKDGSIGFAYSIKRGVIEALEKYFGTSFNEKSDFITRRNGWTITHHAICNGFTVLEKEKHNL